MKYQWSQVANGLWIYCDPNGIIAAQIELDDHTGPVRWVAFALWMDVLAGGVTVRPSASAHGMPEPALRLPFPIPRDERRDRGDNALISPGIEDRSAIGHDQPGFAEGARFDLGPSKTLKNFTGSHHSIIALKQGIARFSLKNEVPMVPSR